MSHARGGSATTSSSAFAKPPAVAVKEQFDQALVCLEDLTKSCKGLYSYAKKRFQIEREYARSLQKLARSTLDATLTPKGVAFQGGLGPCWHNILQSTQECAEMKLSATNNLEQSVMASLNSVFDGELSRTRKELSSQGNQSAKGLQDVVQILNKAQSSYINSAQDWQTLLLQLHRELGGEWRALDNPKLRDKEAGVGRKCEEAKMSYLAAIRQTNNMQHLHHFDQMPPLLTQLSELSEDIVLVARQSMVHLLEQSELLQRSVAKQVPRIPVTPALQAARALDPKGYTNDFIFCHLTSDMVEPPRPFVFEEFLMEDDAAHLFFQKSQYECLMAFPTSETLERSVNRQIDDDGFFISSDSIYQVAESDQDEMRRRMTSATDTIPVPNSRSSVAYMLALRKAVMRTKGTTDPPATAPEESSMLPSWLSRRRLASNSQPSTPKQQKGPGSEDVQEIGRSSWYVSKESLNGPPDGGEIYTESCCDDRRFTRSASEGDLIQKTLPPSRQQDINPYASVDNVVITRRSKRPAPVVPPRPTAIPRRKVTRPPGLAKPTSPPPTSPPPTQLASKGGPTRSSSAVYISLADQRSHSVRIPELLAEQGSTPVSPVSRESLTTPEEDERMAGDFRQPPPLPGEEFDEDPDVYTLPNAPLVGSPGSASFLPVERNPYLAPLPHLVQVCVQYLHKPKVLREEGLFRVSGDITRIRQLKAAFDALENNTNTWSSGRSLAAFLQEEINKEVDPNTVAGLLKMYLREQNFIESRQCKSLVDALYPNRTLSLLPNATGEIKVLEMAMREQLPKIEDGDPVKLAAVRTIIRDEMSAVAQSVLGAMCRLLAKVAKEGDQNRMTSHSLGMCCGLSVFPAMSTGHASCVLRYMLLNWETLFVT